MSLQKIQEELQQTSQKYHHVLAVLGVHEQSPELTAVRELHTNLPALLQTLSALKANEERLSSTMSSLSSRNEELQVLLTQNNKTINSVSEENKRLLDLMEGMKSEKECLVREMAQKEEETRREIAKEKNAFLHRIEE
jgi:ABC-type transporter Mla subunit MlaD